MFENVLISPSILSADFMALGDAVSAIERGGADWVHVDVMDGHFVPNLTIGPPHVKALKAISSLPLDVHLMIENTDEQLDWYLDAGADIVTVHVESLADPKSTIARIKERGIKAGITLKPATSVETLRSTIDMVDMVLIMSVNPGFSGQSFMHESIDRVAQVVTMAREAGVNPRIQVDGGVNVQTAPLVSAAGADCLVAGNAVFKSDDIDSAITDIRSAAEAVRS